MSRDSSSAEDPLPEGLITAAVEACPVGFAISDADGRLIHANPAARALNPDAAPGHVLDQAISARPQPFSWQGRQFVVTPYLDLSEQSHAQRELLKLAYIDSLTGLPNRLLLEEHVSDL